MAVLQNIREKCGVLVIVIVGIALLAFLLGDFLSSGRIGRGDDAVIAKIDGTKVNYNEWSANYNNHRRFYEIVQQGRSISSDQDKNLREIAWTDIMDTYVWNDMYDEVGLGVSDEELEDLLYGPKHINGNLTYFFGLQKNPETGEYDTKNVKNFFDNADDDVNTKFIADYWKKTIKHDQISSKYATMVSKGFYTPTALAKMYYEDQNNTVDIVYAYRDYSSIKDEDITVSDEEMKAYYEEHKNRFVEEENNRDLEYVVFDVVPSESDIEEIKNATIELRNEMSAMEENVLTFAQLNSTNSRPEDRYQRQYKDESFLTQKEVTALGFSEDFFNMAKDSTSDVFQNGNYFVCARILETAMRPDSVNASHILIQPSNEKTMEACKNTADSIAEVLRNTKADSAAFAEMAAKYSQDPGSKDKGGNLGDFTEGTMISEFNNACFANAAGSIQVVESPYGIHIIKINSQTAPVRKIKLAVIDHEIKFSDNTYETVFQASNKFYASSITAEDFDKEVEKQGLNVRMANRITDMNDNIIPGIDNGREIVRWAFEKDRELGDVSNVFESSARDRFIVVKLAKMREKGFTPYEDTKDVIEPEVRKQLKAKKMMDEIQGMSIDAIAQKYQARCDTLTNISFASFSIPGLGLIEPKINAVATSSNVNEVSAPIDGNNGVFVIKVIKTNNAPEKQDFENEKLAKMQESMRNSMYRMNNAVKKATKIDDRRAKFF